MSLRSPFSVAVIGMLFIGGCKSHCDPDETFDAVIVGLDWSLCGDLQTEADRTDATMCLANALEVGSPAYVRLSDDRGIEYFYIDEQSVAGIVGWAGRLGRMGDTVQHFYPCDAATALDAFANYDPIVTECSVPSEDICP